MRWTHAALKHALPRLERHHRRPQLQLARLGPRRSRPTAVRLRANRAVTSSPCDDQGHGTHTTGTTVGDDGAGNQIGVAPGAKWIGCRNMDAGNGTPATYTRVLPVLPRADRPGGQNADPTLRPHVMNNSWGCPHVSELCAAERMQTIVDNTEAAGIFVEASAGNDGSACNTVTGSAGDLRRPRSRRARSAATTRSQSFSSRGPVTVDGSDRMKPDLSAPGRERALVASHRRHHLRHASAAPRWPARTSSAWWRCSGRPGPNLVRDIAATKYAADKHRQPGRDRQRTAQPAAAASPRPAEQPLRLWPRGRAGRVQPRAFAQPDDHVPGDSPARRSATPTSRSTRRRARRFR